MLTIHHLAVSQSERVVWLCEELELPYELVRYERDASMGAPPEFKALHPAGTAPTITDGDVTLAESGAVFEYILRRYGDGQLVLDSCHPDLVEYLFWYHFANGSMVPAVLTGLIVASLPDGKGSGFAQAVAARADQGFVMMEARLAAVPYLAGSDFTAADVLMMFPLTTMQFFGPRDMSAFPNVRAYIDRVTARPAYRRAMKNADPHVPRPYEQVKA
jgi:glutathione S-transferase